MSSWLRLAPRRLRRSWRSPSAGAALSRKATDMSTSARRGSDWMPYRQRTTPTTTARRPQSLRSTKFRERVHSMQAIAVNEYGAEPTVMELPKPRPGPGQILIKIRAAGMNPMDRKISRSLAPGRSAPGAPGRHRRRHRPGERPRWICCRRFSGAPGWNRSLDEMVRGRRVAGQGRDHRRELPGIAVPRHAGATCGRRRHGTHRPSTDQADQAWRCAADMEEWSLRGQDGHRSEGKEMKTKGLDDGEPTCP